MLDERTAIISKVLPVHFKPQGVLGCGGMGQVLLVKDTRLERLVAVKLLKDICDENTSLNEARMMAKLSHHNIVQLYEVWTSSGHIGLVMEYVRGQSLDKVQKERLLSLDEKLHIAIEVARGLAAAHRQDILHCDLKASNILISDLYDVKITDFGVAQLVHTHSGIKEGFGSYCAMSPEQARGESLTARSDLFSFGLLLFELFAGRHAFYQQKGSDLQNAIAYKKAANAIHIYPPLPEALAGLVNQLLAYSSDNRPDSAQQVFERLVDIRSNLTLQNTDATQPVITLQARFLPRLSAVIKRRLVQLCGLSTLLIFGGMYFVGAKLDKLFEKDFDPKKSACFGGAQFPSIWQQDARCDHRGCFFGYLKSFSACLALAESKHANQMVWGLPGTSRSNECWMQSSCQSVAAHPSFKFTQLIGEHPINVQNFACYGGATYNSEWIKEPVGAVCSSKGCYIGALAERTCRKRAKEIGATQVLWGTPKGAKKNECWIQYTCKDLRPSSAFKLIENL
ncbi:serine/threonine protein kinase [Pseudoalteromonas luteoviolacea]|uniref:serine/threonine protein kinase n=1 Tax=Pseudoalteromonas luteoviolacea TaxID=43657 RepID=UPI001B3673F9|nr:serine/threonine-protein kinase [Pseudoalteromonas luteoviolacea]MBQ4811820.1 serine/threonine protein kinase [Pseudoalteromonas luteoviolacea]